MTKTMRGVDFGQPRGDATVITYVGHDPMGLAAPGDIIRVRGASGKYSCMQVVTLVTATTITLRQARWYHAWWYYVRRAWRKVVGYLQRRGG